MSDRRVTDATQAPGLAAHRGMRGFGKPAALSLVVHAVPVALMLVFGGMPLLSTPLPIELREAHPLAQAQAVRPEPAEPPGQAPPPAVEPGGSGPGTGRPRRRRTSKPKGPPPPPPPATADLRPLAPGESARIVLILRNDRLRKSPYRDAVEALLELLPDYRTFLDGTGFKIVDDFDALLLATSNPYDITATFLAARHAPNARLAEVLSERPRPAWDPRVIRFVEPTLSVLTRPDGASRLDRASGSGGPDAGASDDESAMWLDVLRHFERLADEGGKPTLLATINGVPALARLTGLDVPTPQTASLAVTSEASPALRLTLTFQTGEEADQFAAAWPRLLGFWRVRMFLVRLAGALDGLTAVARNQTVEVSGRISEPDMLTTKAMVEAFTVRLRTYYQRLEAQRVDAGAPASPVPSATPTPGVPAAPAPPAPATAPVATPDMTSPATPTTAPPAPATSDKPTDGGP